MLAGAKAAVRAPYPPSDSDDPPPPGGQYLTAIQLMRKLQGPEAANALEAAARGAASVSGHRARQRQLKDAAPQVPTAMMTALSTRAAKAEASAFALMEAGLMGEAAAAYTEALMDWEAAGQLQTSDALVALLNLATCRERSRQEAEAVAQLRRAMDLFPRHPMVPFRLAIELYNYYYYYYYERAEDRKDIERCLRRTEQLLTRWKAPDVMGVPKERMRAEIADLRDWLAGGMPCPANAHRTVQQALGALDDNDLGLYCALLDKALGEGHTKPLSLRWGRGTALIEWAEKRFKAGDRAGAHSKLEAALEDLLFVVTQTEAGASEAELDPPMVRLTAATAHAASGHFADATAGAVKAVRDIFATGNGLEGRLREAHAELHEAYEMGAGGDLATNSDASTAWADCCGQIARLVVAHLSHLQRSRVAMPPRVLHTALSVAWLYDVDVPVPEALAAAIGEQAMRRCAACKARGNLMACPCKEVFFCGRECQRTAWKSHKTVCKARTRDKTA